MFFFFMLCVLKILHLYLFDLMHNSQMFTLKLSIALFFRLVNSEILPVSYHRTVSTSVVLVSIYSMRFSREIIASVGQKHLNNGFSTVLNIQRY